MENNWEKQGAPPSNQGGLAFTGKFGNQGDRPQPQGGRHIGVKPAGRVPQRKPSREIRGWGEGKKIFGGRHKNKASGDHNAFAYPERDSCKPKTKPNMMLKRNQRRHGRPAVAANAAGNCRAGTRHHSAIGILNLDKQPVPSSSQDPFHFGNGLPHHVAAMPKQAANYRPSAPWADDREPPRQPKQYITTSKPQTFIFGGE